MIFGGVDCGDGRGNSEGLIDVGLSSCSAADIFFEGTRTILYQYQLSRFRILFFALKSRTEYPFQVQLQALAYTYPEASGCSLSFRQYFYRLKNVDQDVFLPLLYSLI